MVVAIDVKKTVNSQEAHLTLETMTIILQLAREPYQQK